MPKSRRFTYILSNRLSGLEGGGSTANWANRILKVYGMCEDHLCPSETTPEMSDEEFRNFPITLEAYLDAYPNRIPFYQRLYTLEDCKKAIHFNKSISISFDCFESIYTAPNGDVPYPKIGEKMVGSHCVAVMGGSAEEQRFQFINSWGTTWGNKGWGTLPFSYLTDGLIHECWCIGGLGKVSAKVRSEQTYKLKTNSKNHFTVIHNIYTPLRVSTSNIQCFDLYENNIMIGFLLASLYDKDSLEIEDFFILPQYCRQGIGTTLLRFIENKIKTSGFTKIIGWIGTQDIINEREEKVLNFFKKNKYTLARDNSRFRDAYYKFEKTM